MIGGFDSNTSLHETMHFLGLSDRYTEGSIIINRVKTRITAPYENFENDIMGESGKTSISPVHFKNYINFFKGKGTFILNLNVDKKDKKLLP